MNGQTQVQEKVKTRTIADLLNEKKEALAQVLPKHLTPDRLIKVALNCISKVPKLQLCTLGSLFQAVVQAAELGLEPGSSLGHAYLVPYEDRKKGVVTCQLVIGYRGFIELARRSGQLKQIEAHVVYDKDMFQVEFGLTPVLKHVPKLAGDRGKPVFVYTLARLTDGAVHCEVMTMDEVNAIKARSRSKNDGPWVTDFAEMAKKTVVRRAAKYLPMSAELARALDVDDQDFVDGEASKPALHALPSDTETGLAAEIAGQEISANEKVKEAIRAKRAPVVDVQDGETEEQAEARVAEDVPPPGDADAPL